MNKQPTPEELREGIRTGHSFHMDTPGLKEAAREIIRPFIERMDGQEIIYECRSPWLLRITSLEVDDEGFRATGTPVQEPPDDFLSWMLEKPLNFSARWFGLTMRGSSISMAMVPDCFFPDPAVVAAVKAAAARGAAAGPGYDAGRPARKEIREILERASAKD